MKIIRQKKDLNRIVKTKNISFVPTMGGLHKGHEFLVKKASQKNSVVLVSIFVNPKQFNSKKDFLTYPRNFKNDIRILKKLKVDYLYFPSFNDIFSFKTKNKIYMHPFSNKLCGKFRPGHFKGVLNVVNRLLELIKPKDIFLGQKDFQQLVLIKKHIIKNKINTAVNSINTIRSKGLLPYSSRNFNLNKSEKKFALKVFSVIKKEKKLIKKNHYKKINLNFLKKRLEVLGIKKIDYLEAINISSLKKAKKYNENFNIFTAFYINKIRLIDNI